jgi:hypothetical protein
MKYYNYPDPRGTEVAENVDSKNISRYGGGGGAGLIVEFVPGDNGGIALNSTWQEIANVIGNGGTVVCKQEAEGAFGAVQVIGVFGGTTMEKYIVLAYDVTGAVITFETTSPDGYPESDGK